MERLTASAFSAPETATKQSTFWVPSKRSSARVSFSPNSSDSFSVICSKYSLRAVIAVPIAVAPMLTTCISDRLRSMRPMSRPIAVANAWNACPIRMGTASCSCVRPIFRMPLKSSAFFFSARSSRLSSDSSARLRTMTVSFPAVGITSLVDCSIFT